MLTSFSLFDHLATHITGLEYIQNFITDVEEAALLQFVDGNAWDHSIKRRTQHYGYRYSYKSSDKIECIGDIPYELQEVAKLLLERRIFNIMPNQVIINEYLPGQGIAPHIDNTDYFSDTICSLSLISPYQMDFIRDTKKFDKILEPCSLLVLMRDARYKWQHGIASRKYDVIQGIRCERSRRVSITFRLMNHNL